MGVVDNIRADAFPKQSDHLGKRVEVCFNFNTAKTCNGTIVRDDLEPPWRGIIRLDDGRHVLTTECQYRLPK